MNRTGKKYRNHVKNETESIEVFNHMHPIGTPVEYWRGRREGPGAMGETRSEAQLMGDSAVVWITGVSGCIALTHVRVVSPAPASTDDAKGGAA